MAGWTTLPIAMGTALGSVGTHIVNSDTSPSTAFCVSMSIEKTKLWKTFSFTTTAMVYYVVFGKA